MSKTTPKKWTSEEDAILTKIFEDNPCTDTISSYIEKNLYLLPGRTVQSVDGRSRFLGLNKKFMGSYRRIIVDERDIWETLKMFFLSSYPILPRADKKQVLTYEGGFKQEKSAKLIVDFIHSRGCKRIATCPYDEQQRKELYSIVARLMQKDQSIADFVLRMPVKTNPIDSVLRCAESTNTTYIEAISTALYLHVLQAYMLDENKHESSMFSTANASFMWTPEEDQDIRQHSKKFIHFDPFECEIVKEYKRGSHAASVRRIYLNNKDDKQIKTAKRLDEKHEISLKDFFGYFFGYFATDKKTIDERFEQYKRDKNISLSIRSLKDVASSLRVGVQGVDRVSLAHAPQISLILKTADDFYRREVTVNDIINDRDKFMSVVDRLSDFSVDNSKKVLYSAIVGETVKRQIEHDC